MDLGQRIYYTGDMANAEDFGTIIAVREPNKYAPLSYDIRLDDGRLFKGVWDLSFQPSPGRRFWPLDEWEADRQKRIEAMKADMKRLQIKRVGG